MRPFAFLAVIIACFAAPMAEAAGFGFIELPADANGPALEGAVWYPCAALSGELKPIGTLPIRGVADCPVDGNKLPLVVISTGGSGWFANHYDTAEALAVDFMLGTWPDAAKLDPNRIGFFGFSRGGFTGLVAIGGNPDFRRGVALRSCPPELKGVCDNVWMTANSTATHDPRIEAAVLADPAFVVLFTPNALTEVTVPIQLWASARGGEVVTPESVAGLESDLPSKPEYRVVPNSIHYAFLPPCSAEQKESRRPSCADAPGFDRAAFHKEFNAAVLAFFRQHLVGR